MIQPRPGRPRPLALLAALALAWVGSPSLAAQDASEDLPVFVDVTEGSGVVFRHGYGDLEMTNIVEATGAGVCIFDADGDGRVDLYFVNGAWHEEISDNRGREARGRLANALYRNDGFLTFTDVTERAGVGDRGYGLGCSVADYDADGDIDLYLLNYGANVLYRNEGDGTFTDVTDETGLGDDRYSLSAPWFDYDGDGDLDVYVANYLEYDAGLFRAFYAAAGHPGPLSYSGLPDALYRNDGNGTFTDVASTAGVGNPNGRAMSASVADVNNDGFPDIYVANDSTENFYYENRGDGTFVERALETGLAMGENGQGVSSMGPFFADVNRDGWLDVYVPDMGYSTLLVNRGDGLFLDETYRASVAEAIGQYTSWAGLLFDYDNDGNVDIFVTNGNALHEYAEEDVLLRNRGDGTFADVSVSSGGHFREKYVGRGAACGDLDDDGDLDLVVINLNDDARVLCNDGGDRGNWIGLDLRYGDPATLAIGARVAIEIGGGRQMQDLAPVRGYLSQMDSRLHFGIGDAERVDIVEIRWPDGVVQVLRDVEANRYLRVVRQQSTGEEDNGS